MADVISTDGFIRNGLPGKPMRMAMESKNLLTKQGSIYVGTGSYKDIVLTGTGDAGGTETYRVYETTALNPPEGGGTYTLKCVNGVLQWVAD